MGSLTNEKLLLSLLALLAFGLNSIYLFYFLRDTQVDRGLYEILFVLTTLIVHVFSIFLLIVSVAGLILLS